MGLGSRDRDISVHMTAWQSEWTLDSGGKEKGKWRDRRAFCRRRRVTLSGDHERAKSHARWLWIKISHLMSTPALCLQIINCQMCLCRNCHFHNLSIIYHCHSRGHYHKQCYCHNSSKDPLCVSTCKEVLSLSENPFKGTKTQRQGFRKQC